MRPSSSKYATNPDDEVDSNSRTVYSKASQSSPYMKAAAELMILSQKISGFNDYIHIGIVILSFLAELVFLLQDKVSSTKKALWLNMDRGILLYYYFGLTILFLVLLGIYALLRRTDFGRYGTSNQSNLMKLLSSMVLRSLSLLLLLLEHPIHTLKVLFTCKSTFVKSGLSAFTSSDQTKIFLLILLWVDLFIIHLLSQLKILYLGVYDISSKSILSKTNMPTQSFSLIAIVLRGILLTSRYNSLVYHQNNQAVAETIALGLVCLVFSLIACRFSAYHFPTLNILQASCLLSFSTMIFTYHFLSYRLSIVIGIFSLGASIKIFQVYFRDMQTGEKAFLQLRDSAVNFSWLISLDHVKSSTNRSTNYMMKAIGNKFGTKLSANRFLDAFVVNSNRQEPQSAINQIPQGALAGLGVLGVPVGISGQPLAGNLSGDDLGMYRTRPENIVYSALVADAQDQEFLMHQSLSYFEELEEQRPKDPYIHFLKIQWLLEYFPALRLVIWELEKMESKTLTLKEHLQLFNARQQVEKFLVIHFRMASNHKRVHLHVNIPGGFGWSAEAVNKTDYVKTPYKIINICKPTSLDLGYVFFYKNKIEGLVSTIAKFSETQQQVMVHLEEKKGEKSKLMRSVRKLYDMRSIIDKYFEYFDKLTQKTDFKHFIPYISHLNFNLNLQETARQLLSLYSARQSMLHQSTESKEFKISNTNMMIENMFLLMSSNNKSFGNIVDVYGNYQLFARSHTEIIGKHFDIFLIPSIREFHQSFVDIAINESMDKFRLFGSLFSGFVKVPSKDFVIYAHTTVKVVPYSENEFKYLTLVKPLLNIFEDKFFIMLDSQLNVEAYSYNFLDILPQSYLKTGRSLNSFSTLVYHRVLTLRETRNASTIQNRGNQQGAIGHASGGGNQVGSSEIIPNNSLMSPRRRPELRTKIGSVSGINTHEKDIYNSSAAMGTNMFNFGEPMLMQENNTELEDDLKFHQEGDTSKYVKKSFWVNICYKSFLLGKENDNGYYYLLLSLKDDPHHNSRSADNAMHDGKVGSRRESLNVKDDISFEDHQNEADGYTGSKVDEQRFINEASWIKSQHPEIKEESQELPVAAHGTSGGAGMSIGRAASGGMGAGTSAEPTGNRASSSSTLHLQNNLIHAPPDKSVFRNVVHRNSSGGYEQSASTSNARKKGEANQNTNTKYNSAIGNIDSGFAVSIDRRLLEDQKLRQKSDKEEVAVHESGSHLGTPSDIIEDIGGSYGNKRPLNLNAVLNSRVVTRKYDYSRKRTFGTNQKQKLETIGEMSAYERANSIGLFDNDVSRKTEQADNKESFGSKYRASKVSRDHVNYERAILKPPFPMLLLVQVAALMLIAAGLLTLRVLQYSFHDSQANELANLVKGYVAIQNLNLKMVKSYSSVIRAIGLNSGYFQTSRYLSLRSRVEIDVGVDMQHFKHTGNYNLLQDTGLYLTAEMQTMWTDLSSERQELDRILQLLPSIQSSLLSKQSVFLLADYSSRDSLASYKSTYSVFEGYFTQLYISQVQILPNLISYFDLDTKKSSEYFFLVSNFIKGFQDYDTSSASVLESQYDAIVQNYFGEVLYYMIGYGGGVILFAAVLIVVLVLSLIHFNDILENIFICQPHEIIEKKKSIQKVLNLCQLHQHDNFYFLGTLKDHDLENVSVDSKGLVKFTQHKSKQLHFFGLLRSYLPELLAILILLILLIIAGLDNNNKYKLFKKYSSQLTVVVRSMKIQIEASTLLINNLVLSNTSLVGEGREERMKEISRKLSQLSSQPATLLSIVDPSYYRVTVLDALFQSWFTGNLCTKFDTTVVFDGLCRILDNKVASEGVLQVMLRTNQILADMYAIAKMVPFQEGKAAAYLNSAEYVEHEYMMDNVYFTVYIKLTRILFDQIDGYFIPLLNQKSSGLYSAADILTVIVFLWALYLFWQFTITHNKILFLFFIIPMRSVILSNYLRMRFLSLYELPRTYFGA